MTCARPTKLAPAWRPGRAHVLAHLDAQRRVVVADTDTAHVLWRGPFRAGARKLAWSADGRRLLVLARWEVTVLDGASGRVVQRVRSPSLDANAALVPDRRGHRFTFLRRRGAHAEIVRVDGTRVRRVFAADDVAGIARSPDGHWLLVDWRQADAWLFLPLGDSRVRAREIAHISQTFAHGQPILAGWSAAPR